ncbi:MAG TPA: M23 family metallopeptidase [Blastocatellia bacterium]
MTTAGNGRVLFVAFILVSLTAQTARAQDGIVRAPVPNKQQAVAKDNGPAHEAGHRAVTEIGEIETVIPPVLLIVRRNPNSISIPADEPRYEERAASSSGVKINSDFGYRRDPFTRRSKFHSGIDLKARWGDAVGASHAGVVSFAGWHRGYGNLVIVDHGGGVSTYYAHLSRFQLNVGDKVSRGTVVGYAGSTGRATSPHLHYEVRFEDNPVNPLQPLALDPSSPFFEEKTASPTKTQEQNN